MPLTTLLCSLKILADTGRMRKNQTWGRGWGRVRYSRQRGKASTGASEVGEELGSSKEKRPLWPNSNEQWGSVVWDWIWEALQALSSSFFDCLLYVRDWGKYLILPYMIWFLIQQPFYSHSQSISWLYPSLWAQGTWFTSVLQHFSQWISINYWLIDQFPSSPGLWRPRTILFTSPVRGIL